MILSSTFIQKLELSSNSVAVRIVAVFCGVIFLSLLAQLSLPLPWTPVPITGQTFGVTVMALLMGRRLGIATMIAYVLLGGLGLPIFAKASSGFLLGPTFGYLMGMIFSALVIGSLADKGFTRSFKGALLASYAGSVFVFGFGCIGLSFFVPKGQIFYLGVAPFLLGDFIKNTTASLLAVRLSSVSSN